MNIYIDECGNTGDISASGVNQQPLFVLCGIHINHELLDELEEIEKRYRAKRCLQQSEIKSTNTYASQIDFTAEVVNKILENKTPIWCEVMDKKFYVIVNLVNFTIFQIQNVEELGEKHTSFFNLAADYLDSEFTIEELEPYLMACRFPTRDNLLLFFEYFENSLRKRLKCEHRDGFLYAIHLLSKEINDPNDSFNNDQYFPIPDYTKRGKRLIMLPYVQGFSNLLARINSWSKKNDGEAIALVHDEQRQFDEIMSGHKDFLETYKLLPNISKNLTFPADFDFRKKVRLTFEDSKTIKQLQYADVLTGFFSRAVTDKMRNQINPKYESLLQKLLFTETNASTGVNLVVSNQNLKMILS